MTMSTSTEGNDVETPLTDQLAKRFAGEVGYGLGKISPEEMQKILWEHAREMERRYYAVRAVAGALLK